MLASGAMTSTPGVITSFSCIVLLLPHSVLCARVAASRVETPRTPHGAAGVARASVAPHERLPSLPQVSYHPGSAARAARESWGWNRSSAPAEGLRPSQTERARTDRRLSLLTAHPNHEEVSGAMVRPAVN